MQYGKLVNNRIEYAERTYIADDGTTIVNFNLNEDLMSEYGFKKVIRATLPDNDRHYTITYNETAKQIREVLTYTETEEEYTARKAQEERQRLDQLTLTPSDVERALYYSPLQMDFEDLKTLIATQAPQIDIKGLAIEFRANNFFRGALDRNGNRIIDMVGALLGLTSEDMDYLFEHKALPADIEIIVPEPEPEPEPEEPEEPETPEESEVE